MNNVKAISLVDEESVYSEVKQLKKLFCDKWWDTNKESHSLVKKSSYLEKRENEKNANKFIDDFIISIQNYPENKDERIKWKENINTLIQDYVSNSNIISTQDKEILFNNELLKNTEKFMDEARKFDSSMSIEDIGQAMRNVWIMNIIQIICNKKVELTPSIFGYSMLYPYTDNYLDDTNITKEEKIKISNRFEKRLNGENIEPTNKYEESLFKLVSRIESQYDRTTHTEVFESLLSIHKGQYKSLTQQGHITGPYEEDILGISVEKGGTSVLADAYLVNGKLTEEEATFFFGYGVLLQICDDLQDIKEDFENGHMTIVSQIYKKWPLDNITNGLINFTYELLENVECFDCDNIEAIKELILKNCLQLILFSIAKNKKLYRKEYFNEIKQYFPFRVRYMNKMYKSLKRKYSKMKSSYNGVSIDKIIMEALS